MPDGKPTMIEPNNPEIDVQELMRRIENEVARRGNDAPAAPPPVSPAKLLPLAPHLEPIRAQISKAQRTAPIGTAVPPFAILPRPARALARLVTRGIYYLLQVITVDQRLFNENVLQALRSLTDGLQHAHDRQDGLDARVAGLDARAAGLGSQLARVEDTQKALGDLRAELLATERRVTLLLEEARKRLPEPLDQRQLQVMADEERHLADAFMLSLEEQFRGTREAIKQRLRVYLPHLRPSGAGTEEAPILDIGCGRGEWIELLGDDGLRARGIDLNGVVVEQCLARKLPVEKREAIDYLRNLPDQSIGAVTAFHLVEHLPLDVLIKLLDEIVRVLRPGAPAIFETPNPENLLVGSLNFYMDPTHKNPIPSPVMKLLAENRGLRRVEVINLHPYPSDIRFQGSEMAERLSDYFYGPQDYALLGYKA